ncbi:MAG: 4Fe-4S binding protein [Anaeromyxobacteraceae bacterium]
MSELIQIGDAPPAKRPRWRNPYRAIPAVRWGVQGAYLAFLLLVGWEFVRFHAQAVGPGPVTASRPPSVESFLPISALVGLKRFLLTGYWDPVHPAGLTILAAAIVGALLARKAFCGWICPVGTLSRGLEWLGGKLLWRRRWPAVPRWLDLALSSVKYLLLAFFAWAILWQMPLEALDGFLRSPYNVAADAKMLHFFLDLSSTAGVILLGLVLLSLVVKNAWCRWGCPYGALLGLASWGSPLRIVRDTAACTDCGACTRACPVDIPVQHRAVVRSPECTGCLSCVAVGTVPSCLGVSRSRRVSPWLVPALGVGTMLAFWGVAVATGFWTTEVPLELFRQAYRMAPSLGH